MHGMKPINSRGLAVSGQLWGNGDEDDDNQTVFQLQASPMSQDTLKRITWRRNCASSASFFPPGVPENNDDLLYCSVTVEKFGQSIFSYSIPKRGSNESQNHMKKNKFCDFF